MVLPYLLTCTQRIGSRASRVDDIRCLSKLRDNFKEVKKDAELSIDLQSRKSRECNCLPPPKRGESMRKEPEEQPKFKNPWEARMMLKSTKMGSASRTNLDKPKSIHLQNRRSRRSQANPKMVRPLGEPSCSWECRHISCWLWNPNF